ncbi:MAG: inositol monophosphatase [Chloroflexi bacterium]|nr:inositol monophosphatase [Chloroflexota bacterium]
MEAQNIEITLLKEIQGHAIDSARKAGQILLEHFSRPLEVRFKGEKNSDPVTTADGRVEEYLKTAIREKFPHHNIIGEEGGELAKSDSPFVWVLDPLDGTANFMNGLPLFAVSIGVLWKGWPVVGSIYVPVSHRATSGVYHACLGNGAYLDGEKIEVSRAPSGLPLSALPLQFGSRFRLSGQSRRELHEARNTGSIALELAWTACGVFQYAIFGSPKIWDVAAGVLLVKEAGGLAFSRRLRERNWLPLERFHPQQNSEQASLEELHSWSSPLVVGSPDVARRVVNDIRVPLSWLAALRWRRRYKGKEK